jgi:hypothetical protein
MSKKAWEKVLTPDGQTWRPSLFRLLDERFIEDIPSQGLRLAYPGRPDLYPYAPASLSVAAGLSNQTRAVEELFSCSTLSLIGVWHMGSGQTIVVEGLGQAPPSRGRALVIFCGTGQLAAAGAAIRADNKARQGRKAS